MKSIKELWEEGKNCCKVSSINRNTEFPGRSNQVQQIFQFQKADQIMQSYTGRKHFTTKNPKNTSENSIPINQYQRSLKTLKKWLLKSPNFTNAYDSYHIASPFTENNKSHNSKNTSDRSIWFTAIRSQITLHTLQKLHFQIPRIPVTRSTIDLNAHHKSHPSQNLVNHIRRHNSVQID